MTQVLATFALGEAADPNYGSVRVGKTQLVGRMAEWILNDMRERGLRWSLRSGQS
jgi:hypothetical protein